ncbi:hypothetical protein ACFV0D_20165 [Streptomyces sp. NPDC059556]|uniref:hypothetical protein n=1 Tax=Streptomyces sp. NPDC059556 TaxID=3346863 RepID=UPI00369E46BC
MDEALLLSGLHWADEIRSSEEITPAETELTEDEIKGALTLMDTMTVGSLDELDVTDHYTEALHESPLSFPMTMRIDGLNSTRQKQGMPASA